MNIDIIWWLLLTLGVTLTIQLAWVAPGLSLMIGIVTVILLLVGYET